MTADLAAETFAAALLAAPRYRPGEHPALAWLYGIAAHKLADSRRDGQVEDRAPATSLQRLVLEDEDLARVEECVSLPEPALADALATLPEDQRAAVLARVVAERPYDEIAETLHCSQMVVRQRVSRGLRALRTRLEEKP